MAALPDLWALILTRATIVVPVIGAIGLARLLWRRPAFGLMCVGIMITATYIWANYLELEHYLLVPWLILGLGFSMGLEGLARALAVIVTATGRAFGRDGPRPGRGPVGPDSPAAP